MSEWEEIELVPTSSELPHLKMEPCPLCKGTLVSHTFHKVGPNTGADRIVCMKCGHKGPLGNNQAKARILWNQHCKEFIPWDPS